MRTLIETQKEKEEEAREKMRAHVAGNGRIQQAQPSAGFSGRGALGGSSESVRSELGVGPPKLKSS